jgi:hypothetical protein
LSRRTTTILIGLITLLLLLPGGYLWYQARVQEEVAAAERFHEAQLSLAREATALDLTLGLYYPRFGVPWGPSTKWLHWDDNGHDPEVFTAPGRRDIAAVHYPIDGPYDSREPGIQRVHMDLALQMGLDGLVVDFWGEETYEDTTLWTLHERAREVNSSLRFAPLYQAGEVGRVKGPLVIASDLRHILRKFGPLEHTLRVNGTPVLFVHGVDVLSYEDWRGVVAGLQRDGHRLLLVGDSRGPSRYFLGGYVLLHPIEASGDLSLHERYRVLADDAALEGLLFVPSFSPGFDDSASNPVDPGSVSRDGMDYMNATWSAAEGAGSSWLLLNSVNGWHDGTEVEASVEYGDSYIVAVQGLTMG